MIALSVGIKNFIALHRSVGYKYTNYEPLLLNFAAYMDRRGQPFIRVGDAMDWACAPPGSSMDTRRNRLTMVRGFAEYFRAIEPRTEIPPLALLRGRKHRPAPHIYDAKEIQALMRAASRMHGPLVGKTYSTLLGLLAATGMRFGEAMKLDRADVNARELLLVIRDSKWGKSREVPVHESTMEALLAYAASRDQAIPRPRTSHFFLSKTGTMLRGGNSNSVFRRLLKKAGLPDKSKHRPRIHDLRHTFAVRTLIDWYEKGVDVQRHLPILSTYLGHVKPISTYWYLTAVPELVAHAAKRLEDYFGGLS